MGQHLQELVMPLHQPLLHQLCLDARTQPGTAQEPTAVVHPVVPRGVARDVLAVDRGLRREDAVHRLHQPGEDAGPLLRGQVVVQPVPRQRGMHARRRVPVHRLLRLEAGVIVAQAGIQALPGQIQVALVFGHQEDEGSPGGFRPEVPGLRPLLRPHVCEKLVHAALHITVPGRLSAQRAVAHRGPRLRVEEQARVVPTDHRCPLG